jgi:hypothetical protein
MPGCLFELAPGRVNAVAFTREGDIGERLVMQPLPVWWSGSGSQVLLRGAGFLIFDLKIVDDLLNVGDASGYSFGAGASVF